MQPVDKQAYIERYNRRLQKFGYDPRTLGWGGGRERQNLRFRTLLQIQRHCDEPIGSILDVGCGFGDLYGYLQEGKRDPEYPLADIPGYEGVDINPDLLTKAREVYPEIQVVQEDILDSARPDGSCDVAVASGIFNARLQGAEQYDYIEAMLARMYALSRVGVAVDFMTTYVDWQAEGAFHADPSVILKIARSIGPRMVLRHDYLPYEFCVKIIRPKNDGPQKRKTRDA